MKSLIVGLMCLTALQMQAQLTNPVHKLKLFSGEEVKGTRLVYESPDMKSAYFTLDNERYETGAVEFFQNNHGTFANLGRIEGQQKERYALRIRTGKLNLFEEIEITVYGGDELKTETQNNPQDPMLASMEMYQYYSKGDEAVREASYRNLQVDLADNEKSMHHLKQYRNYRLLQWGLIGVGSGIIAANIAGMSGGPVKFNPVMALGIVVGGGSYFLETPKEDALWLAADEYNKSMEEVLSKN